jgi:hypothetical protein
VVRDRAAIEAALAEPRQLRPIHGHFHQLVAQG